MSDAAVEAVAKVILMEAENSKQFEDAAWLALGGSAASSGHAKKPHPSRSVRVGWGFLAGPGVSSREHYYDTYMARSASRIAVFLSTTPETFSPFSDWKRRTASSRVLSK